MTRLVLGPLLRYVDEHSASVWVEIDRPGTVEVLHASAPTFTVHGHHYALVDVGDLTPGTRTPYEVRVDGELVWPVDDAFPASAIHTVAPDSPPRLMFGSCRRAPAPESEVGQDALSAFARQLAAGAAAPPTALLMIGDQVYADLPSSQMKEFIRQRRDVTQPPYEEIADFEEYAELYRLAWTSDPAVRWLLSTVPTMMIFDDHDVRDDWNTSYAWRQQMAAQSWWRSRIVSGVGAYWIYQHLGNLGPAERARDPLYTAVRNGADGGKVLDEYADRADREPDQAHWSYSREFRAKGATARVVVVDSRCARLLTPDRRAMLDDAEHAWLDAQCTGGVDHLLIVSSIPYLLPPAIHHGEAWNEAVAAGAWGRRGAAYGEKIRQAADLEHWAAFGVSFRSVAKAVTEVARGERGPAPSTVAFLGGDVHYSYVAKVSGLPIYQVVCSPIAHPLLGAFRWANVVASWRVTTGPAWLLAKLARVARPALRWRVTHGPWFDNDVAAIDLDGRSATVSWHTPAPEGMRENARVTLA